MKQFTCVVLSWVLSALAALAETPLSPLKEGMRYQAAAFASSVLIPLQNNPDPARTGIALVSATQAGRALPIEGWRYCIEPASATAPLPGLRVTWPDEQKGGDIDLSFVVWQGAQAGSGTCQAPQQPDPAPCPAGCVTQEIAVALQNDQPLVHIVGPLSRVLTFDTAGKANPIEIPAMATLALPEGKALRVRIADEAHDTTPGPPRFDLCFGPAQNGAQALTLQPLAGTIPVGKTTLTAHVWAGAAEGASACAGKEDARDESYDPSACALGTPQASCQEIKIEVTRSAATLKMPAETIYVQETRFPFWDMIFPDQSVEQGDIALRLDESQNTVLLDGEPHAMLKDSNGSVTTGSLRLRSPTDSVVLSGAQSQSFDIILDPPTTYGSFDAAVQLTGQGGTMAATTLPIKVNIKMPWIAVSLAIALGVFGGLMIRSLTERRLPLLQARSKARAQIDMLAVQSAAVKDQSLKEALDHASDRLKGRLHDAEIKPADLEALVSSTTATVDAALEAHSATLAALRETEKGWQAVLRRSRALPVPMEQHVRAMRAVLEEMGSELDVENAGAAADAQSRLFLNLSDYEAAQEAWLSDQIDPLPELVNDLGSYCSASELDQQISTARTAFEAGNLAQPDAFGLVLDQARELHAEHLGVQNAVIDLIHDLEGLEETETLRGKTDLLRAQIDSLDAARNNGFDQRRLRDKLLALTTTLPDILNEPENWALLRAGDMPAERLVVHADGNGVGAVFSRLKRLMINQGTRRVAALGDGPVGLEMNQHIKNHIDTPAINGYFLRRPALLYLGESAEWEVVSEPNAPAPMDVRWAVDGKESTQRGQTARITAGNEAFIKVTAHLIFEGQGKEITLSAMAPLTGQQDVGDLAKIKKELRLARLQRTVLTGLFFVFFGTVALSDGAMTYATLMTALLLGLGADLSVNSIDDIRSQLPGSS